MKWTYQSLLCAFFAFATACFDGPKERSEDPQTAVQTGALNVWLGLQGGLTSAEFSSDALLRVTGEGIDPALEYVLPASTAPGAPSWSGSVDEIPVGTGRRFEAEIYDTAGTLRYVAVAENVTIAADERAVLYLVAHAVGGGAGGDFDNTVPVLNGVVVSQTDVAPGETVELSAQASDADAGDTLTYAWTVNAGTVESPSSPVTNFTAPAQEGVVEVTLTVSDSRGAAVLFSFDLQVTADGTGTPPGGAVTGGADVTVVIGTGPRIDRINVRHNLNDRTVTLDADVTPNAEGALSYLWSSSCGSTFTAQAEQTVTTLPATLPAEGCVLTLVVTNTAGAKATGTVRLLANGQGPRVAYAPVVGHKCAEPSTAPAGSTVKLCVSAWDPNGEALQLSWTSTTAGTFATRGTFDNGTKQGSATWALPACATQARKESAYFAVKNDSGLVSVGTIQVDVTPNCSTSCTPEGTCAN